MVLGLTALGSPPKKIASQLVFKVDPLKKFASQLVFKVDPLKKFASQPDINFVKSFTQAYFLTSRNLPKKSA